MLIAHAYLNPHRRDEEEEKRRHSLTNLPTNDLICAHIIHLQHRNACTVEHNVAAFCLAFLHDVYRVAAATHACLHMIMPNDWGEWGEARAPVTR